MFTEKEASYIKSQPLARIGTASRDGRPDVAVVGFDFDGTDFFIGGLQMSKTLKYKNTRDNPRASLVIDDLVSADPWQPRGIKVSGSAELIRREGYVGEGEYIRLRPEKKTSWGLN
jgi:pyridoxamine 5'-phosphate oxidase family protein